MSSQALAELADRLNEVRLLCRLDPLRTEKSNDRAVGNAINRACIVLLCAHLEGFLEDLITEAIDVLVDQALVEHLPLAFRALHAEEHLRRIEPIKDRSTRAPRIQQMFNDESELWSTGQTLRVTMVRPKTVCGEMSNPGSHEICNFLKLLDVDLAQHLSQTASDDLLGKVNGLVFRRNSIAHGEVSASATSVDVDQYLDLVEELGRSVDEAVGLAVTEICKLTSSPW